MNPYYADEWVTLYHGDALEVLPNIQTEYYSFVALDPPYAMAPVAVAGKDDGAAGASGSPIRLLSETARETRRVLRPGGVAAVICDWRRVPDVAYLLTLHGLRLTSCVAWTRSTIGTGGMFRSAWDPMLIASSGAPQIVDKSGVPNVVHVNPPRNKSHPYEKPPEVWAHVLRRLQPGVMLDPYAGSGASLAAAIATGNRWVGIECDEAHAEQIAKRRQSQDVLDFGGGVA